MTAALSRPPLRYWLILAALAGPALSFVTGGALP
jgi:hypothetical protein